MASKNSEILLKNINENEIVCKFPDHSLELTIRYGNLLEENSDVIVNSTSTSTRPTGGLDSLIHQKSGHFFSDQVQAARNRRPTQTCPCGQSRIYIRKFRPTKNEPCFIINTVGPTFRSTNRTESLSKLESCFYTTLVLANLYKVKSIAFPAISCGNQNFPYREFSKCAIESARKYGYKVRDIRFVLKEKEIFKAFVAELEDYSRKYRSIDKATTSRPIDPFLISSGCFICRSIELNAEENPSICVRCKGLTRSKFYENILNRLASAASKSFDELFRQAKSLGISVNQFILNYEPVSKFQTTKHKKDLQAESILKNYCDPNFHTMAPVDVCADGSCLYHSFVILIENVSTGAETCLLPIELRVRNIIELVINNRYYREFHQTVTVSEDLVKHVCGEMIRKNGYATIWDLLSMATVLNVRLRLIYPKINGDGDFLYQNINNYVVKPLLNANLSNDDSLKEVFIMFTSCRDESLPSGKDWMPNHYVPLLEI